MSEKIISSSKRVNFFWSWWMTIDRYMLTIIAIMVVFSIIMVTTASPAVAERIGLNSFYFIKRQLVYLSVGIFTMILISFLSFEKIKKLSLISFLFFLSLMIIVLIFGEEIKGAKRWLSLGGGVVIQPSEFIKPFLAIVNANILSQRFINHRFHAFRLATFLYLVVIGLIAMQPDLGMAITISAIWAGQMFLAGLSMLWVVFLSMSCVLGLIAAYMFLPHVTVRVNSFLNPSGSENYQVKKSLEAFTNGGIFGTGPGEGVIKQHLPDSHTDFIFAVIGEEFGMIVCVILIFLFAVMVLRGFVRASRVGDLFALIAVSGLLIQIGFQAVVNIGVTLHLLPTKGMTLPFISYGGSSVLAISIASGFILALTRKRFGLKPSNHLLGKNYAK